MLQHQARQWRPHSHVVCQQTRHGGLTFLLGWILRKWQFAPVGAFSDKMKCHHLLWYKQKNVIVYISKVESWEVPTTWKRSMWSMVSLTEKPHKSSIWKIMFFEHLTCDLHEFTCVIFMLSQVKLGFHILSHVTSCSSCEDIGYDKYVKAKFHTIPWKCHVWNHVSTQNHVSHVNEMWIVPKKTLEMHMITCGGKTLDFSHMKWMWLFYKGIRPTFFHLQKILYIIIAMIMEGKKSTPFRYQLHVLRLYKT